VRSRLVNIISVGEVLWDVMGDSEHLGGAPFNFAAHSRRLGHDVKFVSTVGTDERGERVLQRMEELGLPLWTIEEVEGLQRE
jgi:fructokinase